MTTYQWFIYGHAMADEQTKLSTGAIINIYSPMEPATIVTITAEREDECRRVFDLYAESWRHDGYNLVYDSGRCLDPVSMVPSSHNAIVESMTAYIENFDGMEECESPEEVADGLTDVFTSLRIFPLNYDCDIARAADETAQNLSDRWCRHD